MDNLPNSKLRRFLQTDRTRWIPGVRKGWPKRGRWRLFHYDQTGDVRYVVGGTSISQQHWARSKSSPVKIQNVGSYVGSNNEVGATYYETVLLSIEKEAIEKKPFRIEVLEKKSLSFRDPSDLPSSKTQKPAQHSPPRPLGRGGHLDPDWFRDDFRRVYPKRRQVAQLWRDGFLDKPTLVGDAK
jgi:hypothetical protein